MTTPTAAITAPYPYADIAAAVDRALRRANDPPRPGQDAARTAGKYAALAQNFRDSAWRHLDDDDLAQASNKAWGLAAETIKAISAHHGGFIHKHISISEVFWELAGLARNAGDTDAARQIIRTFRIANDQHSNFYEDELPNVVVLEGLIDCEELSAQLFALFWPDGAPATA